MSNNTEQHDCTCATDDDYACIAGIVYGPCESDHCGGVCENVGSCGCLLHSSPTHDSGYGGIYSA